MKPFRPANPFLVAGYLGPDYFCDRAKETAAVLSALANGRNLTLISPRRIGKTGLIQHVFHRLRTDDARARCFYLDIFPAQNLAGLSAMFAASVLGGLDDFTDAVLRKLSAFFKSFRPSFTFDPLTGAPSVTVDVRSGQSEHCLREVFDYMNRSGKRCVIALDEFQQILDFPEKGVEALLRALVQFSPNVRFIFAGSERHLMDAMFSSAKRPFYQSTEKIQMSSIPSETYAAFAARLFTSGGKTLSGDVFKNVYEAVGGHTWYVQTLLNHLYALPRKSCSVGDVDTVLANLLEGENATYKTYCGMLTRRQLAVLKAVAKDGVVAAPFAADFMRRHALPAPSGIRLALRALEEKSLILRNENGGYFVYDRFFSIWLRKAE
jgi:hypothetical protein